MWAKAKQWINENPEEYAQKFYVDHEGLTLEDGLALLEQQGQLEVPANWDETIAAHQATADLLAQEQGHDELDVADLYDRRYEKVIADGLGAGSYDHGSRAADHDHRRSRRAALHKRVVRRRRSSGKRIPFSLFLLLLAIGPILLLLVGLWYLSRPPAGSTLGRCPSPGWSNRPPAT